MNLESELRFAKEISEIAADMTRNSFGLETQATWKEDNTPLTVTDTAINKMVIEQVQEKFPNDGVLGEEESFESDRERIWVVDPIDGTQPFTIGAPLSSFCLSLVIDGQPEIGIIHDPYQNRMYWAQKGKGAFMNDKSIHVSNKTDLAQAFIVLSSRMRPEMKSTGQIFDEIEKMNGKSFNFRSFAYGSTFVASGNAVATLIGVPNAWDVAATKIIVEEAGGKVTDVNGKDRRYDQDGDGLIATNGLVHDAILELINR